MPVAVDAGFCAANAFPLRLRGRVLGALNLFSDSPGILTPADRAAGQAMADMAAIGLCQAWAMRDAHVVADQLQHALKSRVAIEQAKGMLAQRAAMGTDQAFACLRSYARTTKRLLVDVAGEVVSGALSPDLVLSDTRRRQQAASESRKAG